MFHRTQKFTRNENSANCHSFKSEVNTLIENGVTNFISGGALGFDLIAASLIVAKKEMKIPIRLIFALPYPNYYESRKANEIELFQDLLFRESDEISYISNEYWDGCMYLRNQYMVEHSSYCICAVLKQNSITSQTVTMAKQNQLKIIHVAK